ncbi:MAG: hypothetical protein EON54_21405 [Alcaligenaceae bacterium]|nr:MAG: hypothetical protein EON54_21405 [Alcaligenaceae bacterium]
MNVLVDTSVWVDHFRRSNAALVQLILADAAARATLRQAIERWDWSARAAQRVLRVARTVADLAQRQAVEPSDIAQAIQFRQDASASENR